MDNANANEKVTAQDVGDQVEWQSKGYGKGMEKEGCEKKAKNNKEGRATKSGKVGRRGVARVDAFRSSSSRVPGCSTTLGRVELKE